MSPAPDSAATALRVLTAVVQRSRAVAGPLSLLAVGVFVIVQRHALLASLEATPAADLALVVLLIGLGHLSIAMASRCFLRALGSPTSFELVFHIHVDRLPARYLPGGIWQTVVRAADFAGAGVPKGTIGRLVILEIGSALCLGTVVGGSLLLSTDHAPAALWLGLIVAGGGLGLVGLALLPWTSGPWSAAPRRIWDYVGGVLIFAGEFAGRGLAFFVYLSASLPDLAWTEAVGVYWLSWVAGFLAFFAPQGMGVAEVTASWLIAGRFAAGLLATLLGFRLLAALSDLAFWALYRLARRLVKGWPRLRG